MTAAFILVHMSHEPKNSTLPQGAFPKLGSSGVSPRASSIRCLRGLPRVEGMPGSHQHSFEVSRSPESSLPVPQGGAPFQPERPRFGIGRLIGLSGPMCDLLEPRGRPPGLSWRSPGPPGYPPVLSWPHFGRVLGLGGSLSGPLGSRLGLYSGRVVLVLGRLSSGSEAIARIIDFFHSVVLAGPPQSAQSLREPPQEPSETSPRAPQVPPGAP